MKKIQQKDAKAIASLIDSAATRCMSGEISLEQHDELSRALWKAAADFGIFNDVSALVEAKSSKEMNEALKAMGL
jgi:hypothetical protein